MSNVADQEQERAAEQGGESANADAVAFAARMWAAMRHARISPSGLHHRLTHDYGMSIGRSSIYEALNEKVARPRYVNELAEITKVNLNWLLSGKGTMLDL